MNAIVTVIGKDKVGIIAAVCIKLAEMNVNVLDISQTILDGKFTMVMAVDAANANVGFEELAGPRPGPSSGSWGRGWNCPSASSGKKFSMPCTEYKERERC